MIKTIKEVVILFLIGIIISCIIWYLKGFEFATITLVSYGLLLEILSIISKKEKVKKKGEKNEK